MEQKITTYRCNAKIWLYPSEKASWHFITIPKNIADKMRATQQGPRRGWGAIRVQARIKDTIWETSMFPDSRTGTFLLPIKKSIRNEEDLVVGDTVKLTLTLPSTTPASTQPKPRNHKHRTRHTPIQDI